MTVKDTVDIPTCLSFYAPAEKAFLSGTAFIYFIKFLIKNPANFLLAPLSGILPLACLLT
jgi:hypothetical protein